MGAVNPTQEELKAFFEQMHNQEDTITVELTGAETLLIVSVVKAVYEEGELGLISQVAKDLSDKLRDAVSERADSDREAIEATALSLMDSPDADEQGLSDDELNDLLNSSSDLDTDSDSGDETD